MMLTDRDIEECLSAAANLALFFAGEPDEEVAAAMPGLRAHMASGLRERFGADVAGLIADALVDAVIGRLREIESAMPAAGPLMH